MIPPRAIAALRLPKRGAPISKAARLNAELKRAQLEAEVRKLRKAHWWALLGLLICSVSCFVVTALIIHLVLITWRAFNP